MEVNELIPRERFVYNAIIQCSIQKGWGSVL